MKAALFPDPWGLGVRSPAGSVEKNPPASAGEAGDVGLTPGWGRSPAGNGNPLQCSCLRSPLDRGACSPRGHRELGTAEWLSAAHADALKWCGSVVSRQWLAQSPGILYPPGLATPCSRGVHLSLYSTTALRNGSHPCSSLGGGLADERFGHTTPKQNLESHCVSLRCPGTAQHPCPDSGVAWDAPSGPFPALGGCSRQSTPGHTVISALPRTLQRGNQGAENEAVPQLPSSVQALPTSLTLCCLLWGQQVGLQGPSHRFPGWFSCP